MWGSSELLFHLFHVVQIDVSVTKRVNKHSRLSSCHLCHHTQEQCILCRIVWHAQESITATLRHLQMKNILLEREELVKERTWWEKCSIFILILRIPESDNDTTRFRIFLDQIYRIHQLIFSFHDRIRYPPINGEDESFLELWIKIFETDLSKSSELEPIRSSKFAPSCTEFFIIKDLILEKFLGLFPLLRELTTTFVLVHVF